MDESGTLGSIWGGNGACEDEDEDEDEETTPSTWRKGI